MKKLASMNIPGSLFLFIEGYLTDRTQSVIVDGYQSEKRLVSCGDPQGSVLGTIFSLIYINYLPNVVFMSLALLFADDLKLIHCSENDSIDNCKLTVTTSTIGVSKTAPPFNYKSALLYKLLSLFSLSRK